MARLVLNHSTFIDGLLPVLKKFSKSPLLSSIVPGRLYAARTPHRKGLELRISSCGFGRTSSPPSSSSSSSSSTRAGCDHISASTHDNHQQGNHDKKSPNTSVSHKILARRGSQVQEVFVVLGTNHQQLSPSKCGPPRNNNSKLELSLGVAAAAVNSPSYSTSFSSKVSGSSSSTSGSSSSSSNGSSTSGISNMRLPSDELDELAQHLRTLVKSSDCTIIVSNQRSEEPSVEEHLSNLLNSPL